MKITLFTLLLIGTLSPLFSQVVGGRGNSEMTPTVAEPAKISSGGFSGDVNLFSGGYGATIPLGSVSTPGGLSYSLSYNYNSSFTVGATPPIATGIPYGEGWNLNIPTVSVETETFNNFTYQQYCTEEGTTGTPLNFANSGIEAIKEGDLFWYSPYIDIPGVASGRAIFKYIDVDDNQTAVFVLNSFETQVELRYNLGGWKVITADGTWYHFRTVMQSATAPANRRNLYYDQSALVTGTNIARDVMNDGYGAQKEAVANSISPKVSYNLWYCDEISSRNIAGQGIVFVYEKYGAFNYFQEFKQSAYKTAAQANFLNTTFSAENDFTAYSDILLQRIESHALSSMVQMLKLNYSTDKTIINTNGELIPFYNTNVDGGRLDSLYTYQVIYQNGMDDDEFDLGWNRYQHTKANSSTVNQTPNATNPYLAQNGYVRSETGDSTKISFAHSFLESPRLATGTNDLIPGDIYEVRTRIKRSNSTDLDMGNGTLDISVVTGNLNNPTGAANITTTYSQLNNNSGIYYSSSDYQKTRGISLFSTSNMALKWTMSYNEGDKRTSNFFVMPNLPAKFGGLNVQIGPGNADANLAATPGAIDDLVASNIPNAKAAYVFKNTGLTMKSAANVSSAFGVGLPWGMMIPIYKSMISVDDPLFGSTGNPNDAFKFWWNTPSSGFSHANQPTKLDASVKLDEFELIRYTKNPYMLVSVELYTVNGEINTPTNEGLKLVSKKKMEYTTMRTQILENYAYNANDPLIFKTNATTTRQIHILLKAVREIPIIATTDTTHYLTTFLEYSPFVSGDSTYNQTQPLNGFKGILLSKFVDQLGGITKIEFYPVTDTRTYYTNRYIYNPTCDAVITNPAFGMGKAVTVHPVVKYILKNDENDLVKNGTASSNNAHKRWTYDFDATSKAFKQLDLKNTDDRFHHGKKTSYDVGFRKVSVYGPTLVENGNSYINKTVYEHYGYELASNPGTLTIEDYLYHGKIKSIKQYDVTNKVFEEKFFNYAYTLAFKNGYTRPNPMKTDLVWDQQYDNPGGNYEYKDYYLNQPLSVTIDSVTYTGVNAYPYLNIPVFTGVGEPIELPQFLDFSFYQDLETDNAAHFLHAYFVKKIEEITRSYDDYLSKQAVSSAIVLPEVVTTNPNPFGTGYNNTISYLHSRDSAYFVQIDNGAYKVVTANLVANSPLSDTVLKRVLSSTNLPSPYKTQLFVAQTGLSSKMWLHLMSNYSLLTPSEWISLVNTQPYFEDDILIKATETMTSSWDQPFVEHLFLHNDYLSYPVLQNLLDNQVSYISAGSITAILEQQPQMPVDILCLIMTSSFVPKESLGTIFKHQVLTDSIYGELILNSEIPNITIVEILENGLSYPAEDEFNKLFGRDFSADEMERICAAANRTLESWLISKIEEIYAGNEFITKISYNGNPLTQYCNGAVTQGWGFIENKTSFEYYEADYRGVSNGRAYKILMGLEDIPSRTVDRTAIFGSGGTKTIVNLALKHEPSWQVFSVTSTSIHLPTAKNEEQYFYLYDLRNRYDRYWYNYDVNDLGSDLTSFVPKIIGNDTLAYTAKWDDYFEQTYEDDSPEIPKYDGMTKSRQYNLRTIPYQKTTITKSQRNETAMRSSEYYFYDARWVFNTDFTTTTENYDGPSCPSSGNPTPDPTGCDACLYWKYGLEADFINALPNNYCLWEDEVVGYYACPTGINAADCHPGATLVDCNPTFGEDLMPDPQRYVQLGTLLSRTLQLRSTVVQLDTIMGTLNNEFATKRFDRSNKYIADFFMLDSGIDENGFSGTYRMFYPFDTITTMTVLERNEHFQPALVSNQAGIKTKYYYKMAERHWNVNQNCSNANYSYLYNYMSVDAQNIGLPTRVTVGYSRLDSLSSTFEFTNNGQVKQKRNSSGHYFDYTFDGFNRLTSVTENGNRLLSRNAYNQWNHNGSLSFNDRTNQNYVYSILYNNYISGDTNQREFQKAFIDPLSRTAGVLRAYKNNGDTKIYSGSVTYDNWGRALTSRKPFLSNENGLIYRTNLSESLKTTAKYEHDPGSLPVRAANYGVAITALTTIKTSTVLVNDVYASCELELNASELQLIMNAGSTSSFRFKRSSVKDQDNKEAVIYINAFGQQVATLGWSNLNEKVVTLFIYDNYGNLTKTINPSRQHTDYKFNILGQLVQETNVDSGSKRYMYTKLGKVSAIQDQLDRNHKNGGNISTPRYRKFTYDDYGRPTGQYLVTTSYHLDAFCYFNSSVGQVGNYYVDGQNQSHYFRYTFSNRSTQDWLNTYSTLNSSLAIITTGGLPTGTSVAEKTTVYGTNNAYPLALGKIVETKSYDLSGVAVQKTTFTYNTQEQLASQLMRQHPSNEATTDGKTVIAKIDYVSYNYRGALLEERLDVGNDNSVEMQYFYQYDDLNRLHSVSAAQTLVSGVDAATQLVSYTYNDALGTVVKTIFHTDLANSSGTNDEVQTIDYAYDDRDRLAQISSELFQHYLYYDDGVTEVYNGTSVQQSYNYNGNVNASKSVYNFDDATNAVPLFAKATNYGYTYDGLNRLTLADATLGDFVEAHANNSSNTTPLDAYSIGDEKMAYDKIGNSTTLLRMKPGAQNNLGLTSDDFAYHYGSGNKLTFIDGQNGSSDRTYTYDANGNLLSDDFRSIATTGYGRASYAYNITKGTDAIAYLYDCADGRFYKKVVASAQTTEEMYIKDALGHDLAVVKFTTTGNNAPVTTKEYFVFGTERIARVVPIGNTDRILPAEATFFLYDHLGNTRVSFQHSTANSNEPSTIVNAMDYYPYGKILREYDNGDGDRYMTTMHERDKETGLDYRGARYYDCDVARFLSLDPLARKYPSMNAYNYVIGNPVVFIDPDGKDIVYFDSNGKEMKRTVSNNKFETYVDLKGDGSYVNAPMPNIIEGFEDPKYQKYDYIIAAETYIFNNTEKPAGTNGLHLDGTSPELSPTLVKAIALKETQLGNIEGSYGQKGKSDIMQANVTTSNNGVITGSDWGAYKTALGLKQNGSATPQQSIHAGISILFMKGLVTAKVLYDDNSNLSENSTVNWKGGDTKSWWYAVLNYNGSDQKQEYVTNVTNYWKNSSFSKNPKYYVQ